VVEPNNTQGAGNGPFNVGIIIAGVAGAGEMSLGGDDWFKINCVQYSPITFYLTGYDYYLTGYIYDTRGNNLGTIAYRQNFIFTPSYTEVYYVRMSGYPIYYTLNVGAL
jgi:hypothetical protein